MAVSRLSILPKFLNHFVKLRTLASKNCRVLIGLYSTAAEQCGGHHGSNTTDNQSNSVTRVRMLEDRVSKLEEEVRDLTERYKQALADSDTVRRRTQKFVEDAKLFGIQSFCRDLVEVADQLERAEQELEEEGQAEGRGQRMAQLQDALQGVFFKHGLEKMSPVGDKYDPFLHEIVCRTTDEGAETGTVTLVKQDGYKLHGRTIRHAHVGIAMETQER